MNIPETKTITISRGGTEHSIELDEVDSMNLMAALQRAWGWNWIMFNRADFATALEREITDSEWAEIQGEYTWYESMPDHLTEVGWDIIYSIIRELGLDKPKETVVE